MNTGRCWNWGCCVWPYCLMRSRSPQQTCARLVLPPRKNVVLKLRPQGQPEFILYDCDLVLHERTVNIVVLMMRQEVDRSGSLYEIARTPSSSKPPDNFIALFEYEVGN